MNFQNNSKIEKKTDLNGNFSCGWLPVSSKVLKKPEILVVGYSTFKKPQVVHDPIRRFDNSAVFILSPTVQYFIHTRNDTYWLRISKICSQGHLRSCTRSLLFFIVARFLFLMLWPAWLSWNYVLLFAFSVHNIQSRAWCQNHNSFSFKYFFQKNQ